MSIIVEGPAIINDDDDALFRFIEGNEFPWFYTMVTSHYGGMIHTLMHREEDNINSDGHLLEGSKPKPGRINSPLFAHAENIFRRNCENNGIHVETIYRAAINVTFYEPDAHSDIHVDHRFPHKVFLLYINAEGGGDTVLFNDNDETVETIKSESGKVAIFDGGKHAITFCAPRTRRIVLVFTFDGWVK